MKKIYFGKNCFQLDVIKKSSSFLDPAPPLYKGLGIWEKSDHSDHTDLMYGTVLNENGRGTIISQQNGRGLD